MCEELLVEQQGEKYESVLTAINDFLSSTDGSSFNVCAKLYELICSAESSVQAKLFEQAIVLYEDIESSESISAPVSFFESQKATLRDQYGDLVNSFIEFFVQQQYNCIQFYERMWETIQSDTFFPDQAAKVFAFYYIVIDKRVPYFELSQGYLMSNESFKLLRKKYNDVLRKVRYILSTELTQKTERASLLLKEMNIFIPDIDAPVEKLTEYEKQLIIMVEILIFGDKNSMPPFEDMLNKFHIQASE